MREIFAVCVLLSLITFDCFSQDAYFVNDTWENVIKLSKEQNKILFVYLYSNQNNCSFCTELDSIIFKNSTIFNKLSKEVIFYKANAELKGDGTIILERFANGEKRTPVFIYICLYLFTFGGKKTFTIKFTQKVVI